MNINDTKESKFLAKADAGAGRLMTIVAVERENAKNKAMGRTLDTLHFYNMAMRDQTPEYKACLHFAESEKPLAMNNVNLQLVAKILGSEETSEWAGKQVVIYTDESVVYGGKMVGGIRIRAPRKAPAKAPAAPVAAVEEDMPF
jgi:hypothetical protein